MTVSPQNHHHVIPGRLQEVKQDAGPLVLQAFRGCGRTSGYGEDRKLPPAQQAALDAWLDKHINAGIDRVVDRMQHPESDGPGLPTMTRGSGGRAGRDED